MSNDEAISVEVFPHAPIREALIDIRCALPAGMTLANLQHLHPPIAADYPNQQVRRIVQSHIQLSPKGTPAQGPISEDVEGYVYWNAGRTQAVQFRRNGFTFSRLRPYGDWPQLKREGQRLWNLFQDAIRPTIVERVGLRYINAIEIPGLRADLGEYFHGAPQLPDGLPNVFKEYFSRFSMQFEDSQSEALVQFAFPHATSDKTTSVLLDIHVYRAQVINTPFPSLWDSMEQLRIEKNRIFFSYITESCKELFR